MADLQAQRQTIQRYFTGAKVSNLPRYADFIFEKVTQQGHWGTPTICLGYQSKLQVYPTPDDHARVAIP